MKALVIGATGATGSDLVKVLLADDDYQHVCIFVRKPTGITDPKLEELVTDFEQPQQVSQYINGDILFCCLGTTLKAAGSKEKQRQVDLEIPSAFARIARQNAVMGIVLLSSYGASPSSKGFYSRLKGLLENEILHLAFQQTIIFRPGLLLRKNTDRLGEKIGAGMLRFFNSIGLWKQYQPLPTSLLAKKMAVAPKIFSSGNHIVSLDKIFKL